MKRARVGKTSFRFYSKTSTICENWPATWLSSLGRGEWVSIPYPTIQGDIDKGWSFTTTMPTTCSKCFLTVISFATPSCSATSHSAKVLTLLLSNRPCCSTTTTAVHRQKTSFLNWFGPVSWTWIKSQRHWWCLPKKSMIKISSRVSFMSEKTTVSFSRGSSLSNVVEIRWASRKISPKKCFRINSSTAQTPKMQRKHKRIKNKEKQLK